MAGQRHDITGFAERGILVRTAGDPLHMVNALQQAIWATDRNVGLTLIGSLHDSLRRISYSGPRFALILLGVFASVGLMLVGIGVFSVMAYAVSRQTHEIGLRMASGPRPADVLRMVLARGAWLLGIGTVVGLLVSLAATRLIASQIWGVSRFAIHLFLCVLQSPVCKGANVSIWGQRIGFQKRFQVSVHNPLR
jgi:putative ABC transport system permease protein